MVVTKHLVGLTAVDAVIARVRGREGVEGRGGENTHTHLLSYPRPLSFATSQLYYSYNNIIVTFKISSTASIVSLE